MTAFQRLLLIPCLSPVVLMLLIATLNLGQPSSLRVLTWRLPPLPIGAWIAVATVFGIRCERCGWIGHGDLESCAAT